MRHYRVWLSFTKGIGIYIRIGWEQIEILLPFVEILIGVTRDASGIYFFGLGRNR